MTVQDQRLINLHKTLFAMKIIAYLTNNKDSMKMLDDNIDFVGSVYNG